MDAGRWCAKQVIDDPHVDGYICVVQVVVIPGVVALVNSARNRLLFNLPELAVEKGVRA